MSSSVSPIDILTSVAGSFVAKQRYASIEEALQDIARTAVRNKITYYRQRIRKLERTYATDLETFTARLKGRATPAEEDDWCAWLR